MRLKRARLHASGVRDILVPVGVALGFVFGLALRIAGDEQAARALWVAVLVGVLGAAGLRDRPAHAAWSARR